MQENFKKSDSFRASMAYATKDDDERGGSSMLGKVPAMAVKGNPNVLQLYCRSLEHMELVRSQMADAQVAALSTDTDNFTIVVNRAAWRKAVPPAPGTCQL